MAQARGAVSEKERRDWGIKSSCSDCRWSGKSRVMSIRSSDSSFYTGKVCLAPMVRAGRTPLRCVMNTSFSAIDNI